MPQAPPARQPRQVDTVAGAQALPCIVAVGPGVIADTTVHSPDEVRVSLTRDMHHDGRRRVHAYQADSRRQRRCIADASGDLGFMATTEGDADDNDERLHAMDGCRGTGHTRPAPLGGQVCSGWPSAAAPADRRRSSRVAEALSTSWPHEGPPP